MNFHWANFLSGSEKTFSLETYWYLLREISNFGIVYFIFTTVDICFVLWTLICTIRSFQNIITIIVFYFSSTLYIYQIIKLTDNSTYWLLPVANLGFGFNMWNGWANKKFTPRNMWRTRANKIQFLVSEFNGFYARALPKPMKYGVSMFDIVFFCILIIWVLPLIPMGKFHSCSNINIQKSSRF